MKAEAARAVIRSPILGAIQHNHSRVVTKGEGTQKAQKAQEGVSKALLVPFVLFVFLPFRFYDSATTNTSLDSPRSRAEGVMMVFFPTVIFALDKMAARTSSSQTNPTGLDSLFSAFGFGGSSSL